MNLGIIGNAARKVGTLAIKKSPTILTISATVGVVATAYFTGKAVIEAQDMIKAHEMDEELKCERIEQIEGVMGDTIVYYRERTLKEKIYLTWKSFIPPVLTGGTTIACIFGAHHIDNKRQVALAAAYSMSEEAAKEFRDKVKETIGEKKVDKIDHEIAQDHVNRAQYDESTVALTGDGDQLMYDWWSQRYFKSSRTIIEKKVIALQKRMLSYRKNITMNDFYKELGLSTLPIGDDFGFKYSTKEDDELYVSYYPIFGPNQEPCTEIMLNPELLCI